MVYEGDRLKHPKYHHNKPLLFCRQIIFLVFGIIAFIVAFAWNDFVVSWIKLFKGNSEILVSFLYALVITVIAILVIYGIVKLSECYNL
jgi:hypothetical protein